MPISHASVSSFHHIYPREPEFLIHQGPTSSGLEPFCCDKFELKQNNYYDSIQDMIKNSINHIGSEVGNIMQSSNNVVVVDDDDDDDDGNNNNDNNKVNLRGLLNEEKDKSTQKEKYNEPQRHRRPSIQYSHEGHPNCFDYDWVIVPPDNTKL